MRRVCLMLSLAAGLACAGSDDDLVPSRSSDVEVLPLASDGVPPALVSFVDEATGFATQDVYDATREVVHFDAAHDAMVASETGDAVAGWRATGNDLSWSRSGTEFRVRFGTELGERRAYFTETIAGTICDLRLYAPGQLGISGTAELPPSP